MTDLDNQINKVTNPEEAVAEFIGEEFVTWAREYIQHALKSSAPMNTILQAQPKPEQLKKFLLQVFPIERARFGRTEGDPGFLGFAIANLSESDDPEAEAALEILEQRQTDAETLPPESLAKPWSEMLLAAGSNLDEAQRTKPKEGVRLFISELSDLLSNSEWQTALGAFAAYEWALAEIYPAILHLMKNTKQAEPPLSIVALKFDERQGIDTGHILDKAVLDQDDKQLVWRGIHRQTQNQIEFLATLVKYLN